VGPRVDLEIVQKIKILTLPEIEPRTFRPWPIAVPTQLSRLIIILLIISIISIIIFCAPFLFKQPVYNQWAIIVGVEISVEKYKAIFDKYL
jgi:hypothetical protein